MSDAEEQASCDNVSDAEDGPENQQAVCCGSAHPHPVEVSELSATSLVEDVADNFSLEVHLGGDNSQHASEVSTMSYQNLLEEGDTTNSMVSRRGSEDSTDSYPTDFPDHDFPEDLETFEASDLPLSEHYNLCIKQLPRKLHSESEDSRNASSNQSLERKKEKEKFADRNKFANFDARLLNQSMPSVNVPETQAINTAAVTRRKTSPSQGNALQANIAIESGELVRKRNSLEIRNNIPVVGEVKQYEDVTCTQTQGMKPKIKNLKQSPGLARRVCDQVEGRDGSSSDRESEGYNVNSLEHQSVNSCGLTEKMDADVLTSTDALTPMQKNMDIENEYDYVKYARVQHGNSYVGMRLAYSSSNDSLSLKRGSLHSHGSDSIDSSREPSPEKVLQHQHKVLSDFSGHLAQGSVCEESLTEIPLNASDSFLSEGKRAFTLSPETTECDSVEVESVTSDGDNSMPGFPTVEDGLSSSQASEGEEGLGPDLNSPSHILHMKQKAEVDQEMRNTTSDECQKECSRDIDAQAIMNDLKAKREALDMAIADIKSAIQRSKQVALQSPFTQQLEATEPVWIRRYNSQSGKLERQEEMRRVRDAIECQQEEMVQPRSDKVVDDESVSLSHSHQTEMTVVPGKQENPVELACRQPRGCDSDDECEEVGGMRYTRRNKGKKYALLRKDDSLEHGMSPGTATDVSGFGMNSANHNANGQAGQLSNGSNHVRNHKYGSKSQSSSEDNGRNHKLNSQSQYSSEDNGSDVEPASKGSYLLQQPGESDTDEETDRLLQKQYQKRDQYVEIPELDKTAEQLQTEGQSHQSKAKEGVVSELRSTRSTQVAIRNPDHPEVLIEGVLFRARYLGSTQLVSEGQPSKAMRMMQAQEAVGRIKTLGVLHFGERFQAPEGENQPSTDVDLFVSTEKIMVLNTDLQEIMMDHTLRTISYIADIGDILVIMARRRILTSPDDTMLRRRRQAKILCHVFESDEAQLIAQSIGQAFQVAYLEFLKANGIEDPGLLREMDYQDVLNQQEIYGEELQLFANKDFHKEVIVPKMKGEPIGVVIVESGWGSMVPTVVLANMLPNGPAARCGQLNIGDQIISINGVSLVGLPLSSCQTYVKAARTQTVVKLTVVPCPPVVEVLIKRPDVKYQLGFSVQNGVICSLLRGGIAERGGVRVGHRIIEINNQSVVAVPHERIVSLLANSVGEIHMKTMPTSIFRLLTGQDVPHYL